MSKLKKGKVMYPTVKITWVDSVFEFGWIDAEGGIGEVNPECHSVGYLMYQDEKEIVLGQSYNEYQIASLIHIPQIAIVEIIQLEEECQICKNLKK